MRAPGDWPGKDIFDKFSQLLYVVTLLALLCALVLIGNTMTTLVGEQTREIGAMKAIGGRRRQITWVYVRTALLLGAIGSIIGVALGLVLANVLVNFFGSTFFAVSGGFGVDVPIVLASLLLGLLGPPLAALPAIRRGVRVPVREALETTGSISAGGGNRLDALLQRVGFLPRTAQIGVRSVGRRRAAQHRDDLPDRVRGRDAARRARARHVGVEPDPRGLEGSRLGDLARLEPATRRSTRAPTR